MGLLDNFAKLVAEQITKAAPEVAPIPSWQMDQQRSYGNTVGLPRDPNMANVPFTPGLPLLPGAINPVRPDGRPDPRRYEYQVAQNINITETRLVPFKTLRAAAEQIDILRRCVEVMKQKMVGLDWDIVLSDDAVEKVMAESGEKNRIRAISLAKTQFGDEISRAKSFWEVPDVSNGLIFADWLNMALEDVLVLDAWAVWPQKTVGGDLRGIQCLDGSTIKPLIDDRGMRPSAPQPAFQQILYGFPRSEFAAPTEDIDVDGEFTSDELAYMIRNRRTTTIYGLSPVERALPLADIYLRRQQWIRAEYTDGVIPELMFETDANFGNNPDLLRAYENILNDDLSGQTEQRKRARLLPAGLHPVQMDGYGEKFKDVLDEFLVTSICGHFGVQPSEIGFTPKSGLGGAGHQKGQGESSEVIGLIPLQQWVGRMLSQLSYVWLGMPRELEFKFMASERTDDLTQAQVLDSKVRGGLMTVNEARAGEGLPLIDSPMADQPIFVAGAGVFTITDDGLVPVGDGGVDTNSSGESSIANPSESPDQPADETTPEPKPEPEDSTDQSEKALKAQVDEAKAFMRWLRKSPSRAFEFKQMPVVYAETLNKFVAVGDFDGARWYAECYIA